MTVKAPHSARHSARLTASMLSGNVDNLGSTRDRPDMTTHHESRRRIFQSAPGASVGVYSASYTGWWWWYVTTEEVPVS